jgi:hypothetical protein
MMQMTAPRHFPPLHRNKTITSSNNFYEKDVVSAIAGEQGFAACRLSAAEAQITLQKAAATSRSGRTISRRSLGRKDGIANGNPPYLL